MTRRKWFTGVATLTCLVLAGCGAGGYVAMSDYTLDLSTPTESTTQQQSTPCSDQQPSASGPRVASAAASSPSLKSSPSEFAEVDTAAVERAVLPNVIGMTRKEAKKVLTEAGSWRVYKVRGTKGGYDTGKCKILSQSPNAGQLHDKGAKVFVTFPPAPILDVPNIVGQTEKAARTILSKAKFSTRYVKRTDRVIIAQVPAAGEKARQGSSVKVTLE